MYRAPSNYNSYFYTNNDELEKEITDNGWIYKKIDFNLSDCIIISSKQAKYIKFLQMLKNDDHAYLKTYDRILYIDHKFFLQDNHIDSLLKLNTKPILIRITPRCKSNVWQEFDARGQMRYNIFESQAMKYVKDKLLVGYKENVMICNTGLILYDANSVEVLNLVNEIYDDLTLVGTPECQIIWAMVSQKYENIIYKINFNDVPILWMCP